MSLLGSSPFGGAQEDHPEWRIEFTPVSEEAGTWDAVFKIQSRYAHSILKPCYESWLREFRNCCRGFGFVPLTADGLLEALERYRDVKLMEGLSDRALLKAAVFDMLLHHCRDGDARLIQLLLDLFGRQAA